MTLQSWLDANDNRDLVNTAGDLAADALASYYGARDLPVPASVDVLRDEAASIAFAGRDGWSYAARDENDPAGEIALAVLARRNLTLRTGSIGYDATYILNA